MIVHRWGATVGVTTSASQATVSVSASSPTLFGQVLGIPSAQVSARAVVSQSAGVPCSNPGSSCYAFFAMDQTCSDKAFSLTGGTNTINGSSYTNSALNVTGGTNTFAGPVTYGKGCTPTATGGTNVYNGGSPSAASPSDITSWPIDYSTAFPACSGAACTGPLGTPPFCTYAIKGSYSFNTAISPTNSLPDLSGVYCAVGSSGTPATPSTWTGSITISGGSGTATATFVAGSETLSNGSFTMKASADNLFMYATNGGVTISGGSNTFTGDVFAPSGLARISGGTGTMTTMVEADKISLTGGSVTGDGPTGSASAGAAASESLIQ